VKIIQSSSFKRAKLHTPPPLAPKGDEGKRLICRKEEGKLFVEKMQKYTPLLPDMGKKKGCRMRIRTHILLLAALPTAKRKQLSLEEQRGKRWKVK